MSGNAPLRHPPVGELHRGLLELYAPPSILIGAEQEIIHLSDAAGAYLRHSGGVPTSNLLRLVLPGLRIELRAALYAAATEGREQARLVRGALEEGGERRSVRTVVRPVREPESARGYFLVLFEELTEAQGEAMADTASALTSVAADPAAEAAAVAGSAEVARHLEEQIGRLQMQLLSTVEQYEASAEELKASNEELQAMNEELRSAAEELETSKEELQSLNEELTTVNQELKSRMDEVNRTNSDLQNLLVSTDIATIFLDRELRLKRYTPVTESLFNVIPTDLGRPLVHLTHRLNYPALAEDVERVLERLVPVEREVMASGAPTPVESAVGRAPAAPAAAASASPPADVRHFLARLLPYRTIDDRIDGVVITFIDITARKRSEEALRASEARLATIFSQAAVGLSEIAPGDGRFLRVNDRLCRMVGRTREELLALRVADVTHPGDIPASEAAMARTAATGEPLAVDKRCLRPDGAVVWTNTLLSRLDEGEGRPPAVLAATVDLTARKEAEQALRESEERFRLLVEGADDYAMLLVDPNGHITFWNSGAERLFGWSEAEAVGMPTDALFTTEDREQGVPKREIETARATGRAEDERWHVRKDGSRFWADGLLMRLDREEGGGGGGDDRGGGGVRGYAKITRDATDRLRAAEALRRANEGLETRVGERTAELSAALSSVEMGLAERGALLRQLVTAQEAERARISRELHDELGQHLTAFGVGLRTFEDAHPEDSETLVRLREIVSAMSREVHRIAVELRPTALDDLGLVPALESYAQQWEERTGIRLVFQAVGMEERPSPEAEAAIYRVVQEALTNVARHAGEGAEAATRVAVTLQRHGDEVRATVEDNGPGFDARTAAPGRLGLAGMRERAQLVGGTLEVESAPGEGTTVYLRLPASGVAPPPT